MSALDTTVLVISLVILGVIVTTGVAGLGFAPWLPSRRKDAERAIELAEPKDGERFYDLGCGSGGVVLLAARQFGLRATGIELAPALYIVCRLRAKWSRDRRVEMRWGNLYSTDLSDADIVYLFGSTHPLNRVLRRKLERELRPGARVVCNAFPLQGREPDAVVKSRRRGPKIFLYRF